MSDRRREDRRVDEGLWALGVIGLVAGLTFVPALVRSVAEVGVYAVLAGVFGLLGISIGPIQLGMVVAAAVVGLGVALVLPRSRRSLWRVGHRVLVRRRWRRALAAIDVSRFGGVLPQVRRVRAVPAGDRLRVIVPTGGRVADLETAAEAIAAALGVREVRVSRDPANACRAWVTIVRRDPLAGPALVWPYVDAQELSLWEPIPVGVDEDGGVVTMALPERNLLLGGEPGAGKSAALSLVVATAALDPTVKLWLFDGKLVELAGWARCAERSVGVDVGEAIEVLRQLQSEMEERYRILLANRRRKVEPGDGLALHVVVVDELAHYLNAADRKQRSEFAEVMRDLVSRGRAAGLIVIGATQKPSADIIPTALRDLFGFRWALRCSTPQASDTILGSGWASSGYSAAEIDAACRGVGYLLHEGGQPVRLRAYYLDDEDLAAIAERAELLREQRNPAELRVVEG